MGGRSSKLGNETYFTEYEYNRLGETFHINTNDFSTVTGDTFRAVWSHFLVQALMETWIQYFIRNEFHYQFKATFDLGRCARLYRDQTSPFMDIKALAVIRIILGADVSERIRGINRARVLEYFRDVIISYIKCLEFTEDYHYKRWIHSGCTVLPHHQRQLIEHFVSDIEDTQGYVTDDDLERWLRERRFVDDVLGNLLDLCFSFNEYDQEFHPLLPIPIPTSSQTILDISHILFLESYLMIDYKHTWVLVYSSSMHGQNFTKLIKSVTDIGPTIFVIKETRGNLFGCFASESWKPSATFYGDSRCFLFQLAPHIQYYQASGYNMNFMYHNTNQQTLANGFGLGGQLGFWALWIDSDFGQGRCENYCSTFKNYSSLSKNADFTFEHLEVWALDSTTLTNQGIIRGSNDSTILTKDPTAKALLDMAQTRS